MHPHCNAPEVLHATALVQQGLKLRISTSFSSADMRSWRSERSKISSFATSPLRVQLPASANPPTTLPNHPHARKPNPLKAGARARRNHRLPGLDEGASAAPMASVLDETCIHSAARARGDACPRVRSHFDALFPAASLHACSRTAQQESAPAPSSVRAWSRVQARCSVKRPRVEPCAISTTQQRI